VVRTVEHGHAFPSSLSLRKRALEPPSRVPFGRSRLAPSLPFLFLPLDRGGAKRSKGSERQGDSDGGMPPSRGGAGEASRRGGRAIVRVSEAEEASLVYVRAREEGMGGSDLCTCT